MIEQTHFKGWRNCWRMSNGEIESIVSADVGPRVISLGFAGGQNLFKNFEAEMGKGGEAAWMSRGGSRIWIGPEDPVATYAPDNLPVTVEIQRNTLIASAPVQEPVRVQKQMIVTLPDQGSPSKSSIAFATPA